MPSCRMPMSSSSPELPSATRSAAESLSAIEKRLKDSDRFETVEVRKRYRSLDDPTDVAIVLVVHERPGVTSATSTGSNPISAILERRSRTG